MASPVSPIPPSLPAGLSDVARCLPETEASIRIAADLIRAGEVIVYLTDTLYGLGADATNEAAVARVFAIKGRAESKPLLVLVRDFDEAARCGRIDGPARLLAERFWPGPLTLVVEREVSGPLARSLNPLGTTIGIRVPARAMTRSLIQVADRPLTAPSANRSGDSPARSAGDALAALGDDVALALDGGPSADLPSTVVSWSEGRLRLLREGGLSREDLAIVPGLVDR